MLRFSVAFLLWLALASTPSTSRVIEPLSWSPRAFVYRSFLSSAECAALREAAEPRLAHAAAEGATGEGTAGVFFERAEFPLLQAVEARAAAWSQVKAEHFEPAQILRYGRERHEAHTDVFTAEELAKDAHGNGQRVATARAGRRAPTFFSHPSPRYAFSSR